jgi:hypothetical protein
VAHSTSVSWLHVGFIIIHISKPKTSSMREHDLHQSISFQRASIIKLCSKFKSNVLLQGRNQVARPVHRRVLDCQRFINSSSNYPCIATTQTMTIELSYYVTTTRSFDFCRKRKCSFDAPDDGFSLTSFWRRDIVLIPTTP